MPVKSADFDRVRRIPLRAWTRPGLRLDAENKSGFSPTARCRMEEPAVGFRSSLNLVAAARRWENDGSKSSLEGEPGGTSGGAGDFSRAAVTGVDSNDTAASFRPAGDTASADAA